MILFLLKNRRLSVHLFVALLLVLGTVPEGSEGFKCYKCFMATTSAPCEETTDCPEGQGHCSNVKYVLKTGAGYSKGCMANKAAECFKQIYGSSCVKVPNKAELKKAESKVLNCARTELSREEQQGNVDPSQQIQSITWCACKGGLCNTDITDTVPDTGHSDGHPTSIIIIAILTVAFFNYIK